MYFPPICTVPNWGKKYHFGKGGGGENMIFGKIYTPAMRYIVQCTCSLYNLENKYVEGLGVD